MDAQETQKDTKELQNVSTNKNFWGETIKLLIIALIIIVPFRLYIAQPFIVDGASMDPTFATGQYLIVDELTYHFTTPARGSVIIFKYPLDPSKFFIKRIIGLPGETVILKKGIVSIVNSTHPKGFVLNEPYIKFTKDDNATYTLGPNEYFVMGDNRFGSADSRYWGPMPTKDIIGRPILRIWPPTVWPGDETSLAKASENAQNK